MATIFSKIIAGEIPCYKVAENDNYFAFLDINPLAKGHTLVVPKCETDYIFDLDDQTLGGMVVFAKEVASKIFIPLTVGGGINTVDDFAAKNGTIITVTSQCQRGGTTLGTYATSNDLVESGAISASDMTAEAAIAKLYYLFSCGYDTERVKLLMETNLRGEMNE